MADPERSPHSGCGQRLQFFPSDSSAAGTDVSSRLGLRSSTVSDIDLVPVERLVPSIRAGRDRQSEEGVASGSLVSERGVKSKRVRVMADRRREQCRVNQARYRKKQTRAEADLEVEVSRLRMDVLHLEARRRTLHHAINTRDSCARVVVEYFRTFRHGFRPSGSVHDQHTPFVIANFHPSVRVGETRGCAAFLALAQAFTRLYDDPSTDLIRIWGWSTSGTDTTINTTLRTELTVSETTIREIFPHVMRPENSRLGRKLVGQRLAIDARGYFVLDATAKVEAYDWGMDFTGALQKILTLEETAIVLGQADLAIDGSLPDVSASENDRFAIV